MRYIYGDFLKLTLSDCDLVAALLCFVPIVQRNKYWMSYTNIQSWCTSLFSAVPTGEIVPSQSLQSARVAKGAMVCHPEADSEQIHFRVCSTVKCYYQLLKN